MKVQEKDLLAYDWEHVLHWFGGEKTMAGFDDAVDDEVGAHYMYDQPAMPGAARLTFSSRPVMR